MDFQFSNILISINGVEASCAIAVRPAIESGRLPTKNDSGKDMCIFEKLSNAPPTDVRKQIVTGTAVLEFDKRLMAAIEKKTIETLSPILPDSPVDTIGSAEVETAIPGKPLLAGPIVIPVSVTATLEVAKTLELAV